MQEPGEQPGSAGDTFLNHAPPPGKSPWPEHVVSTLISAAQSFIPRCGSQGPQSALMLPAVVLSVPRIWRAWQAGPPQLLIPEAGITLSLQKPLQLLATVKSY